MKKEVLQQVGKVNKTQHNIRTFLMLSLLFSVLSATTTVAQNYTFYKVFESCKTFALTGTPTSAFTTPGFLSTYTQGVVATDYWRGFGVAPQTGATAAYSGVRSLSFIGGTAGSLGYLITPRIVSPTNGTMTLSFQYRLLSPGGAGLIVEFSSNYGGGGADPNAGGVVWTQIGLPIALTTNTSYTQFTGTFSPGAAGGYIRIRRTTAGGQVPNIDDIGWSSSVAAENLQIILNRQTTAGLTSSTTPALLPNTTYMLYDNGGESDGFGGGIPSNITQDAAILLTPPAGQLIELSFITAAAPALGHYDIATLTAPSLGVGTTNNVPTNSSMTNPIAYANYATPTPGVPSTTAIATSPCAPENGLGSFRFTAPTIATNPTGGFGLIVRTVSPISCADPTLLAVTTAAVTASTAPLTWNALTGCSTPGGNYDYYVSNVNSAPAGGPLTPSNTGILQAGNTGSTLGSFTVTGLQGSTTFWAWIRSNCGANYGNWIGPVSFTTVCAPITPLLIPAVNYVEDFQSGPAIPSCTFTASGASSTAVLSGNRFLFTVVNGAQYYTKPFLLDNTKIYRISYRYGNAVNNNSTFQIQVGTTSFQPQTATYYTLSTVSWNRSVLRQGRNYFRPLTSGVYYIRFVVTATTSASMLDDIEMAEVPCWPATTPVFSSGAVNPCSSAPANYTVTAVPPPPFTTPITTSDTQAPTSFTWTPPSGWVSNGSTTATVTVTTGAIPGNMEVVGNFAGCDSSLPLIFAVSASAPPAQPSTISGNTTICTALPTAALVYSVTNVVGTTYNWSFPSGWTITAGAGTSSVTVTATVTAQSGTIQVTPSVGSCAGVPRTLAVVVSGASNVGCSTATPMPAFPAPSVVTDTFRCNQYNLWYTFTAVCSGPTKFTLTGSAPADNDLFIYTGCSGATGTGLLGSGQGVSPNESVTVTLTAGVTYFVRVLDWRGLNVTFTSTGGTFTVSGASLSVPNIGIITGTPSISCSSSTTTTYSVDPIPGYTFDWVLPGPSPDWVINSGAGTNSITVTALGTVTGTLSVVASGPCGSTLPATLPIVLGQIAPGPITGATGLCSSVAPTTYTIDPVVGATSYTWTFPAGWVVSAGAGTESITVTPSATSGNVSVTASGPCGTSQPSQLAVSTAPAVSTTGAAVCQGAASTTISLSLNAITGSFPMSDVPTSGAPTFVRSITGTTYIASATVPYTTITIVPTVTGTYTFDGCASGDTFLHIYNGTFTPATPAVNFLAANDDSNPTAGCVLDPRITITLTAGQPYVFVYSTFISTTSGITGIVINFTGPIGGGIQVGQAQWWSAASGGTLLGTGTTFDPVAAGALPNTNTPGTYTYFATNSLTSFCRTPTNFVINASPTASLAPGSMIVCSNTITPLTVTTNATNMVWTSTVPGTLFQDSATIVPYTIATTNLATIYVRSISTVTVTVTTTIGTCTQTANVTFSVPTPKTWNAGVWAPPGVPTAADAIIIQSGNYTAGDLTACTCTVNAGATMTFNANQTLTLTNSLIVNTGATVTFEDDSSLIQINDASPNSGNIRYRRTSPPVQPFDYIYWSSPVAAQVIGSVFPNTPWTGFYSYTGSSWLSTPTNAPMIPAKGYIVRTPNFHTPSDPINAEFLGTPNNGVYNYPVVVGATANNLIGNPYPSALDIHDFLSFGTNATRLDGTIYLWAHLTLFAGNVYNQNDYVTYNFSGGVGTGALTSVGGLPLGSLPVPGRYIGAGQSFFIRGLVAGDAVFNNAMREGGPNNTQFYRNASATTTQSDVDFERNRLWLDIANTNGATSQMMYGYIESATAAYDRGFDGELNSANPQVAIYTKLNDTKLTIQARDLNFNVADEIPLSYSNAISGDMVIALPSFDGFFVNQEVYLEDKALNIIHDLKASNYQFYTEAGTFDDRFVLRFNNGTLGVVDANFNENTIKVYKNTNGLHVDSGTIDMETIKIFDVAGRLLVASEKVNATTRVFTTLPKTNQVLLVQVTSKDGIVVTKKVIY
jgi:hypothetical protein